MRICAHLLLVAISCALAGCGPGSPAYKPTNHDPKLEAVIRAKPVKPIIDAIAAYHLAKGSYPNETTVITALAPYCPPGTMLNLSSDPYVGWSYEEGSYGTAPPGLPGGYNLTHQINHGQGLFFNFDGIKGEWYFRQKAKPAIPILLSP
jgi:hypothetical protein